MMQTVGMDQYELLYHQNAQVVKKGREQPYYY